MVPNFFTGRVVFQTFDRSTMCGATQLRFFAVERFTTSHGLQTNAKHNPSKLEGNAFDANCILQARDTMHRIVFTCGRSMEGNHGMTSYNITPHKQRPEEQIIFPRSLKGFFSRYWTHVPAIPYSEIIEKFYIISPLREKGLNNVINDTKTLHHFEVSNCKSISLYNFYKFSKYGI